MIYLTNVTIAFKSYLQHLKHVTYFLVCTHVTGDVPALLGMEDRDGIRSHVISLGDVFNPLLLVVRLETKDQRRSGNVLVAAYI